jgi:hypothetical protein
VIGFFALIFFVVMVIVLVAVLSTLAWLLSAGLIALAVSVLAGLAFSTLVTGTPDLWSATALISGGAIFILSMSAFRALGRRRAAQRRIYRNPTINVSARRVPDPAPAPPPPVEPRDGREPELTAAFDRLAGTADFARSRLGVVRSSCVLFLGAADGLAGDGDAADFAILIRKRVPEHIDECLSTCRSATATEAKALLEEAVVDLERLGARADKRRSALIEAAGGPGKRRSLLARRLDEDDPFA